MIFKGFHREGEAIEWSKKIIGIESPVGFCRAISAVDLNDEFCVVVVLSNFTPRNIDLHVAAVPGARWASPVEAVKMFNAIFSYVFLHLGAARVTGLVRSKNTQARKFDEHLGFKLEGLMREAFSDDDLCIYGLLRQEYLSHRWYREQPWIPVS